MSFSWLISLLNGINAFGKSLSRTNDIINAGFTNIARRISDYNSRAKGRGFLGKLAELFDKNLDIDDVVVGDIVFYTLRIYNEGNVDQIIDEVKKAVIGKDKVIIKILLAILAKGHILLEDIPGVGKTTLALAFSKSLSLDYNRVQFTPDVLPTDITGFTVYNKHNGNFEYLKTACRH